MCAASRWTAGLADRCAARNLTGSPCVPHRIQEIERIVLGQKVQVQLWDCAGGIGYEPLWGVLGKGIEGIILVGDP